MEYAKKYIESYWGDDVLWNHKFEIIGLGLISMFLLLRKKLVDKVVSICILHVNID